MRQAAGELADRLHLLRMAQLLALGFRLAPLGQVAHDADEGVVAALRRLTDRKLHRKGRAVLAPSHHLAAGADDLRHAGREIGGNVAVVLAVVRLRHQDADVLPDDFVRAIAEQADAGLVEGLNDAVTIDGDQAVHHRVENGGDQTAEPGLAGLHHVLGGDSLGDVAGDLAEGAQGAVGRSDGGDDNIGQEARAILAHALADIFKAAGRRGDLELTLQACGPRQPPAGRSRKSAGRRFPRRDSP